jgi:hypothetical protein
MMHMKITSYSIKLNGSYYEPIWIKTGIVQQLAEIISIIKKLSYFRLKHTGRHELHIRRSLIFLKEHLKCK